MRAPGTLTPAVSITSSLSPVGSTVFTSLRSGNEQEAPHDMKRAHTAAFMACKALGTSCAPRLELLPRGQKLTGPHWKNQEAHCAAAVAWHDEDLQKAGDAL